MLVGIVGGLIVGMTSVGSGSLIIVALLLLYPTLKAGQLVGTDLVQAVPLVASAALGHLLFGDFQLGLTASLLVGRIPGVYVGARVSVPRTRRPGPAGARRGAARVRRSSCSASRPAWSCCWSWRRSSVERPSGPGCGSGTARCPWRGSSATGARTHCERWQPSSPDLRLRRHNPQ